MDKGKNILEGVGEALILGVIGGVGAGKSTILDLLEREYHFTLLRTDDIAKSFYVPENKIWKKLLPLFGKDILKEDGSGEPDFHEMARKLYQNRSLREKVDAIVHPAVWDKVEHTIKTLQSEETSDRQNDIQIAIETALPEGRFLSLCDEILYVFTEPEIRIERLMETRGYTRERAQEILRSQHTDAWFRQAATLEIDNSGTIKETEEKLSTLLERIK